MTLGALSVGPGFFAALALFYLFDGQGLFWRFLLCFAIHELGHIAAAWAVGAKISGMKLGAAGGIMQAEYPKGSYFLEFVVAAGGPVSGIVSTLVFAALKWHFLAGTCLAVTLFNLMPIRPLDGGHMLHIVLCALCPGHASAAIKITDGIMSGLFFTGALVLYIFTGAGLGLTLIGAVLIGILLRENKEGKI